MVRLKIFYLNLIEKEKKNTFEWSIFLFLIIISYLSGLIVGIRDFLYDKRLLKIISLPKKIVSVGNISWGGTGKTSLVIYLHKRLSENFKVCTITKGYAKDEFYLIREQCKDVFDSKKRINLIKSLTSDYDVFILDDGFQYRRLKRDLDIVLLRKVDLQKRMFLIPASGFREPLRSLRRADMVVVTYCLPQDFREVEERILKIKKDLKVFFADYVFSQLWDKNKKRVPLGYFQNRRTGVLTAIGYPEGFLKKLSTVKIKPEKILIYPDHYEFGEKTFKKAEGEFISKGIKDIIVTHKDFYRLPLIKAELNYFVFGVELKIHQEERFLQAIKEKLRY